MEATQEVKKEIVRKSEPGTHATKIFVFYRDNDTQENHVIDFATKSDFDAWLEGTNVDVKRVFRGVEKKTKARFIFV